MNDYVIRFMLNGDKCETIVPGVNPIAAIIEFDDMWDVEGAGIDILEVRKVTDD